MNLWTRLSGQMMRQLLSVDDVVAMRAIKQQSEQQVENVQKAAAGTVLMSSNMAARGLHLGVQMGAKSAGAAANAMAGWVPGAGMVRDLAEQIDEQASAAGERAARLASFSVELAGGEAPANPVSGEPWLGQATPAGYGWRELTADTAASTLWGLTAMPRAAADNAMRLLHDNRQSRRALHSSLETPIAWLEGLPAAEATRGPLRQVAAALAAVSSLDSSRTTANLMLGAGRLAAGDTRQLHLSLQEILADAKALTTKTPPPRSTNAGKSDGIDRKLRDLAKEVLRHRPDALLSSLDAGPDGRAPDPSEVAASLLEDGMELQRMLLAYAQLVAWRGTPTRLRRGAQAENSSSGSSSSTDEPESGAQEPSGREQIDRLARQLARWIPSSKHLRDAASALARDLTFLVASETLGVEAALTRTERLEGSEARQRLAADPSLDLQLLGQTVTEWRPALRLRVNASPIRQLRLDRPGCRRQLDWLSSFAHQAGLLTPPWVIWRQELLDFYLKAIDHRCGLEDAHQIPSSQRIEAAERFQEWLAAG